MTYLNRHLAYFIFANIASDSKSKTANPYVRIDNYE